MICVEYGCIQDNCFDQRFWLIIVGWVYPCCRCGRLHDRHGRDIKWGVKGKTYKLYWRDNCIIFRDQADKQERIPITSRWKLLGRFLQIMLPVLTP